MRLVMVLWNGVAIVVLVVLHMMRGWVSQWVSRWGGCESNATLNCFWVVWGDGLGGALFDLDWSHLTLSRTAKRFDASLQLNMICMNKLFFFFINPRTKICTQVKETAAVIRFL